MVSYSGIFFEEISQEMASPVMVVFFVAKYPGKGEIPFQDVRRGLAMFSLLHVFLVLRIFSSWIYYVYSLLGVTRFESFVIANG